MTYVSHITLLDGTVIYLKDDLSREDIEKIQEILNSFDHSYYLAKDTQTGHMAVYYNGDN